MSLARFCERVGKRESDVYVFGHVAGGFECCGCELHGGHSVSIYSATGMLKHMELHRQVGACVPPRCFKALREEAKLEREIERAHLEQLKALAEPMTRARNKRIATAKRMAARFSKRARTMHAQEEA